MKFQDLFCQIREESGSYIVEFALCSNIFFLCIFAIIYASVLLYTDHYVTQAANSAVRYAAVRGSTWNGKSCSNTASSSCSATADNVSSYVQQSLPPGLSSSGLSVTTTWPGTTATGATCDTASGDNSPNCVVQVQIGYSFQFPMPFIPQKAIPLSATAEMSIME